MTDAMQITVSSEMENRIDDSNSTAERTAADPRRIVTPSVEISALAALAGGMKKVKKAKNNKAGFVVPQQMPACDVSGYFDCCL